MINLLVNFPVVKLKFLLMYLFMVSKERSVNQTSVLYVQDYVLRLGHWNSFFLNKFSVKIHFPLKMHQSSLSFAKKFTGSSVFFFDNRTLCLCIDVLHVHKLLSCLGCLHINVTMNLVILNWFCPATKNAWLLSLEQDLQQHSLMYLVSNTLHEPGF